MSYFRFLKISPELYISSITVLDVISTQLHTQTRKICKTRMATVARKLSGTQIHLRNQFHLFLMELQCMNRRGSLAKLEHEPRSRMNSFALNSK